MLIEIGATLSPANFALAEALAKLGVPLTETNMIEGQSILARLPDVSPAVFALSKALDLPPTPAIMRALSGVLDRSSMTNRLDIGTLDLLSLLPHSGHDANSLSLYIRNLFDKLGQSTENKLLTDPDTANTLKVYDIRSSLLELAATNTGGQTALAADKHASYIEGQQLLNQVSVDRTESSGPLYFAFPILLASREAACEVQLWPAKDQKSRTAEDADKEEYLHATIRVDSERLGVIETTLIGFWSGRLNCTLYAAKPTTVRLLKRESSSLAKALGALGWSVAPITVVKKDRFVALWLGGELLDNPRVRVDQRI